ncbi:hypothetical protein DPMN_152257 [Dreissena polymorpha]|uniref:Uncharacterized protein n=1 Tax=Dreissena polymorpha TaxID=45954 RepID=A0A9D4FH56_DREPO|nr:hypothetical protein DPMN_152257 [Dreissena polymorpha]
MTYFPTTTGNHENDHENDLRNGWSSKAEDLLTEEQAGFGAGIRSNNLQLIKIEKKTH